MAKIRVEVNANKISSGIKGKWGAGLYKLCAVIRDDCNKYVRMTLKATLRKSSYSASQLDKGLIIWNTPYARRVYYTGTPRTGVNPNASLQWCEKAKAEHLKKWRDMAAQITGGK
ncbi:MAG TPA: minor capsid protein [Candidatus Limiplasma sp.]|nr:minor capsid protein [Candidatus Limiplasma sp.]HPS80264.1 minor capsid protein [Candidatus Limiplasma sp.]